MTDRDLRELIEDAAREAITDLGGLDPGLVDLDTLLAIGLQIRAITTRACAAQMKVEPDADPV